MSCFVFICSFSSIIRNAISELLCSKRLLLFLLEVVSLFRFATDAFVTRWVFSQITKNVAQIFVTMHRSVVASSEKMLFELKRHNYVTPTNYLELVSGYKG